MITFKMEPGLREGLRKEAQRRKMNLPELARFSLSMVNKWGLPADPNGSVDRSETRAAGGAQLSLLLDAGMRKRLKSMAGEKDTNPVNLAQSILKIVSRGGLEALLPAPAAGKAEFSFCDLFAGIGGIRTAFESAGGRCVFSSEWDKFASRTYYLNHREWPHGDITRIKPEDINGHDMLTAGFPCQPFSIAGVSKKNSLGHEHGFRDKTQGTLFRNVAEIIAAKRPSMFLLENVKNLRSHDRGKTFGVIEETMKELEYEMVSRVIDARHYVPQHRERIFMVGYDRRKVAKKAELPRFDFPEPPKEGKQNIRTVLHTKKEAVDLSQYHLSRHLWKYLRDYAEKHRRAGNGFGFGLVGGKEKKIARTLSARYFKDGSEILVERGRRKCPRRLTPRECARLMGFSEEFGIPVSDTQAYKQFGNSVVVPVVEAIAKKMAGFYRSHFSDRL